MAKIGYFTSKIPYFGHFRVTFELFSVKSTWRAQYWSYEAVGPLILKLRSWRIFLALKKLAIRSHDGARGSDIPKNPILGILKKYQNGSKIQSTPLEKIPRERSCVLYPKISP